MCRLPLGSYWMPWSDSVVMGINAHKLGLFEKQLPFAINLLGAFWPQV